MSRAPNSWPQFFSDGNWTVIRWQHLARSIDDLLFRKVEESDTLFSLLLISIIFQFEKKTTFDVIQFLSSDYWKKQKKKWNNNFWAPKDSFQNGIRIWKEVTCLSKVKHSHLKQDFMSSSIECISCLFQKTL